MLQDDEPITPGIEESGWRCNCGALHSDKERKCSKCGMSRPIEESTLELGED